MSSSSICPHFTQNAWKKDLCSNCFKSRDEHRQASINTGKSMACRLGARFGSSTSNLSNNGNDRSGASIIAAKADAITRKTDYPNRYKTPTKSIMKNKQSILLSSSASHSTPISGKTVQINSDSSKANKVCFSKTLSEVIGYGGEWSDSMSDENDNDDDDHDFMNLANDRDEMAATSTDDEDTIEIKRITRDNTDFNMNNGNLLDDSQDNIKKSFAALKLGAPQVDKEGKKQTLMINVVPFGALAQHETKCNSGSSSTITTSTMSNFSSDSTASRVKAEFERKNEMSNLNMTITTTTTARTIGKRTSIGSNNSIMTREDVSTDSDGKNSPPIERAMEKSLLDEISETLEMKQSESQTLTSVAPITSDVMSLDTSSPFVAESSKIKVEITSLSETQERSGSGEKSSSELKKTITRNTPITKEHLKPKVIVIPKYVDTESSSSENDNSISAYYDVVETTASIKDNNCYENLPDGKYNLLQDKINIKTVANTAVLTTKPQPLSAHQSQLELTVEKGSESKSTSSQYVLLSSKTRAASYNLHEGSFMTSKITPDGLIVTAKCNSEYAMDSTGSSFDGSSDEEISSYNIMRSESDSGIGISINSSEPKNSHAVGTVKKTAAHNITDCVAAEIDNCVNQVCNQNEENTKNVSSNTNSTSSNNNSDYEDIQVTSQASLPYVSAASTVVIKPITIFSIEKSRELHGEPDGSADPDGRLESKESPQQLPALPKSPPPIKIIDARPSFLHGLQKPHPAIVLKKPDVPAKPTSVTVSPCTVTGASGSLKTFITNLNADSKRQLNTVEQNVINQLQLVMSKPNENLNLLNVTIKEDAVAKLKKGRAPNPPPEMTTAPISAITMMKCNTSPKSDLDYNSLIEHNNETISTALPTDSISTVTTIDIKKITENVQPVDTTTQYANRLRGNNIATSVAPIGNNSNSNNKATINKHLLTPDKCSPVVREKEKRAIINPKFRSLNTFVLQRSHLAKQLQLQNASAALSHKQPLTPESTLRVSANKLNLDTLSMSDECLSQSFSSHPTTITRSNLNLNGTMGKGIGTAQSPSQKNKTKFSFKKFLRMGVSKTTDNLHKKDGIYSEICTDDELSMAGKPRLVIIHPIDINPMAVEVVKDITKTNDTVSGQTVTVVTSRPPAPPLRATANAYENNKPARPPPPKSAEVRRKQKIDIRAADSAPPSGKNYSNCKISKTSLDILSTVTGGSVKCKSNNVYANLGEIRSAIAPRKPERTASMREREAQLELARKRIDYIDSRCETDSTSICSSNDDIASELQHHYSKNPNGSTNIIGRTYKTNTITDCNNCNTLSTQLFTLNNSTKSQLLECGGGSASDGGKVTSGGSRTSTFERQKQEKEKNDEKKKKIEVPKISSKLEIFEQCVNSNNNNTNSYGCASSSNTNTPTNESARMNGLKDSVRKISSTIDSYLKDKRDYENIYEFVKSPEEATVAVSCSSNKSSSSIQTLQSPPPPPVRSATLESITSCVKSLQLLPRNRVPQQQQQPHIYPDTVSIASYTRSEYTPTRNYGLHASLANIPRIISTSYCGSEIGDLDIYAPYSYYGSEVSGDVTTDINDSVWGIPSINKNRGDKTTNRLRMRKGRSVVHKTIEDNYMAVVVANHEALAQVLEQLQLSPIIPPALRPLANAINLRFEDFTILDGVQAFVVGKKAFHTALWATAVPVTLALSADSNQLAGVGGELNQQLSGGVCDVLNPITEFCDLVPSYHLPLIPSTEVTLLQATISVLPRLQLDTLPSIGTILKGKSHLLGKSNFNFRSSIPNLAAVAGCLKNAAEGSAGSITLRNVMSVQNLCTLNEESTSSLIEKTTSDVIQTGDSSDMNGTQTAGTPAFDDVMTREVAFIMLQLVNGMKNLQVKAIEEMPLSLSNVVLSKEVENRDAQARLCVLQSNNSDEEEPMGTLCKCAHHALTEMLPNTNISPILANILLQERAESLSKAKSVLEFTLWGPSDVVLTGSTKERELAMQRWLDLERATVLHGLVRTRVELTVYDECHLLFLVRSNAKIIHDAAKIVYSYQQYSASDSDGIMITKTSDNCLSQQNLH